MSCSQNGLSHMVPYQMTDQQLVLELRRVREHDGVEVLSDGTRRGFDAREAACTHELLSRMKTVEVAR